MVKTELCILSAIVYQVIYIIGFKYINCELLWVV